MRRKRIVLTDEEVKVWGDQLFSLEDDLERYGFIVEERFPGERMCGNKGRSGILPEGIMLVDVILDRTRRILPYPLKGKIKHDS